MERLTVAQVKDMAVRTIIERGMDTEATTIRCLINDINDHAAKQGMKVNHHYQQSMAVNSVRRRVRAYRKQKEQQDVA